MKDGKEKFNYIKILCLIISSILIYMFLIDSEVRQYTLKIINPILVAFAIAYILDWPIRLLAKKSRLSRKQSIVVITIIVVLFTVFSGTVTVPKIINAIIELLDTLTRNKQLNFEIIDKWLKGLDNEFMAAISNNIDNLLKDIAAEIGTLSSVLLETLMSKTLKLSSALFSVIISFVIAIYMLFEKQDLFARIKRMLYAYISNDKVDYILYITRKGNDIVSSFIIGKLIDSLIIGILCFIILLLIGVPYSTLIAIIVGITNIIPYFGPFIGGVPAVFITLLTNPGLAIWVVVVIIALQQFDGLVLGPKILGDKVGVSAFWIILAVTVGGAIAGVLGMFLGVPVLVLIKTLVEEDIAIRLKAKNMANFEVDKLSQKH